MTRVTRPITDPGELAQSIFDEAKDDRVLSEGDYSSLGMLINDAILRHDVATLRTIHDSLRLMYGIFREDPGQIDVSRFLGMIDVTYWALRRIG